MKTKLLNKKIYIYDFDDTICDTWPSFEGAINAMLQKKGITHFTKDQVISSRGMTMEDIMSLFFPNETFKDAMNEFIKTDSEYEYLMKLKDGVVEFLSNSHKENKIQILVSNRGSDSLIENLKRFNILHYFDFIQGKEAGVSGKPSIEAFIQIQKKFPKINEFKTEDMIFFGDAINDIEFCKNIGIKDLFLIRNSSVKEDFYNEQKEKNNFQTINSFLELI